MPPLSGLSRDERGPSGPCNHRRRFERQLLLATLTAGEANSGSKTLGFQVRNPSGKFLTAIAVGFAQIGGQGSVIQPVTVPGTWDLTPAFLNNDGAPIPLMKVVDSTQANSTSNPTDLPNGWEVQTMAPLMIGKVNLDTSQFDSLVGTPEIGVYVCVAWEDVSGSFDPVEVAELFALCGVFANGPPPKLSYV